MVGCSSDKDKSITGAKPDKPVEGTVHVATTGNDKNDGSTMKTAFLTVQRAIDFFEEKGGGIILIHEGTYNERLFIGNEHSGTQENPLVIKAAPDEENPVYLDGSPLPEETDYSVNPEEYNFEEEVGQLEMIYIECANYIQVEGLEICNNSTPHGGWEAPMGILIAANEDGGSTGVEILNNKIYNIDGESWGYRIYIDEDEEYVADMNGHGIAAYGEGPSDETVIDELSIIGNEVYNNKTGQSESVVVNGNVKNFKIKQNFIHDNNNIGIDVIGGEETSENMGLDCARFGEVSGNVVINNSAASNQTYDFGGGCDGIYVDGGKDTYITNNYVIGSDYCFEIGTENEPPFPLATGIVATNNILLGGDISAMMLGGTEGAHSNIVENNSIYSWSPYELERNREKKLPNTISKNIFVTPDPEFNWPLSSDKKSGKSSFLFGSNVYFGGTEPAPKKHKELILTESNPFENIDNGEFRRSSDSKLADSGADVDEIIREMDVNGPQMNGAALFEIAKANYIAREAIKPDAEKVKAALMAAKGTADVPLTLVQIGASLTDYLAGQCGGPEGTVVGMKHIGETYEGGEEGEALNAIEEGKGKYFGMIQIGRGEDGKILNDNIKTPQTLTNIRVYYKVPYTYTVENFEYTSWLVGQINDVCVEFVN